MSEFTIKIDNTPKEVKDHRIFVSRDELKEVLKKYTLKPGYSFDDVFPEFSTKEKIFIDEFFLSQKLKYFDTTGAGGGEGGEGGGGGCNGNCLEGPFEDLHTEAKEIIAAINEVHDELDVVVPRVDKIQERLDKISDEDGIILPDIIDTDQIIANSVTADKIQANSINAGHIQAEAIESKHIGAEQIVAGHIQAGAITTDKIESEQIVTKHIAADQIVAGHIAANQIDAVHINTDTIKTRHISAEQIVAEHIKAGEIKTDHLAAGSITAVKIQSDSIETRHLTAGCVVADKIATNAITSDKIEANAITSNKIQANSIEAFHINGKIITGEHIVAGAITAGSGIIANGAIGSAQISDLEANKLTAGTIDTSLIKIKSADSIMEITGNQIMVNDTSDALNVKNRVILGKYRTSGDSIEYGLLVRSADGRTTMIDGTGVHNAGITDGAIDNNKVADDANISGTKLDIDSVITTINNDGSINISGTKVQVGNGSLDVHLSQQTQKIEEHEKTLESHSSSIKANADSISMKVDSQVYERFETNITERVDALAVNTIYTAQIMSKNGNIFVNGDIFTTLTVVVKEGSLDITDTLDVEQFVWSRVSDSPTGDRRWNAAHENAGHSIDITSDDVLQKATFEVMVVNLGENNLTIKAM